MRAVQAKRRLVKTVEGLANAHPHPLREVSKDNHGLVVRLLQRREQGKFLGIGLAKFVEVVRAGPIKQYDIVGLKMLDAAELRVHSTGKAVLNWA